MPMRCFNCSILGLEVALAPVDVAVPFEGRDVRDESIEEPTIVADHADAVGESTLVVGD